MYRLLLLGLGILLLLTGIVVTGVAVHVFFDSSDWFLNTPALFRYWLVLGLLPTITGLFLVNKLTAAPHK